MNGKPDDAGFVVYRNRRRVGCVVAVASGKFVGWSTVEKIGTFGAAGEAHDAVMTEAIRLSRRRVRP